MERTINIGIIGAGIVGERLIKAIQRHGRTTVAGICDVNLDRLAFISKEYHIPTVTDYKELIQSEDVDIIYLAVPPKYHYAIAMDIIRAKKHFLCEKPLANSIAEAKEMYEEAENHGRVHAINFPTVYTPAYKKLGDLVGEGFLGKLRRIELHGYFRQWPRPWQQTDWIATREQGGFVREVFTHYVQMIQSLFGAMGNIHTNIQYPQDQTMCETGIIATAALKDGTPVLLNGFSDVGIEESLSLNIYGSEGTLSLVNWRELWASKGSGKKERIQLEESDHLVELLSEVIQAMKGGSSRVVTFKEGYEAQIVIERLLDRVDYEAVETDSK